MSTIYIIKIADCFLYTVDDKVIVSIPDNYDEILSCVLKFSGTTVAHPEYTVLSGVRTYFTFQSHRLLNTFWDNTLKEMAAKKLMMWEGDLPAINTKQSLYAIVKIANRNRFLVLDTSNQRVFLPDGRILPENKAQEWHAQVEEMMAFGQQQMDLGFPQSNPLIKNYFIEQLSPQLTDLGLVFSTHEPDIVFSHPKYHYQFNIGLDGECGMYEIFADLVFHQATEQIAQLFNQPFTGSELTVSVNQLINWQLPVDYRSIRDFDDIARFIQLFNKKCIPLLKAALLHHQ